MTRWELIEKFLGQDGSGELVWHADKCRIAHGRGDLSLAAAEWRNWVDDIRTLWDEIEIAEREAAASEWLS